MTRLFMLVQDSMANKGDYVELGKSCAGVCEALDRGLNGRRLDNLSQSVLSTIEELTTRVGPLMPVRSDPLTKVSIAELWPRSRGISLRRVNGAQFLDSSTQRTTTMVSLLGGRT